jgi:hypothetical protein
VPGLPGQAGKRNPPAIPAPQPLHHMLRQAPPGLPVVLCICHLIESRQLPVMLLGSVEIRIWPMR